MKKKMASDRRIIHFFIHIPKCGGSSFSELISRNFNVDNIYDNERFRSDRCAFLSSNAASNQWIDWKHFYEKNVITNIKKFELVAFNHLFYNSVIPLKSHRPIYTYCLFRDPKLRVASHYLHLRRLGTEQRISQTNNINELYEFAAKVELEEFCSALHKKDVWHTVFNLQVRALASKKIGLQEFIEIGSENILADALLNLKKIDFVGTLDVFSEFARLLCHVQNWPDPGNLLAQNIGGHEIGNLQNLANRVPDDLVALDRVIYQAAQEQYDRWQQDHSSAVSETIGLQFDRTHFLYTSKWVLDFRLPLNGKNFHSREGLDAETFRWLGPDRTSELTLPLRLGSSHQITLYVKAFINPTLLSEISLTINDVEVDIFFANEDNHTLIYFNLTSEQSSGTSCIMSINVPFVSSEAIEGWGDDRRLKSLALSKVIVEAND